MSLMRPLSDMREEMNRIFREMEAFQFPALEDFPMLSEKSRQAWLPAVDITEKDGNYVLKAEMPGIKPEDIDIEVLDDTVVLRGETREEKTEDRKNIFRRERRVGSFYRRVPLPGRVNKDNTRAELTHGVLQLTLPKSEESARKSVKIEVR